MTIKVHTITPECKLTKDALNSGYDLKANITEPVTIEPGGRVLIPCGIKLQIPLDYEAQVRPRSGLAIKHGITVLNAPGTIDAGYRGEVGVIIYNAGHVPFTVSRFDRIAQLVFAHVVPFDFWECSETDLTETKRGAYGFGSTGTGYII